MSLSFQIFPKLVPSGTTITGNKTAPVAGPSMAPIAGPSSGSVTRHSIGPIATHRAVPAAAVAGGIMAPIAGLSVVPAGRGIALVAEHHATPGSSPNNAIYVD